MSRRRLLLNAANAVPEGWYKPADTPNGVFACVYKNSQIYAVESSVYTADKASFTDYLMGVAVVTADTRFIIRYKITSDMGKRWDYDGTGVEISGVTTTTSSSSALSDYNGKSNSAAIIAALESKSTAAYTCSINTFLNGDAGYLPALGQMKVIYDNKTAINNLLTAMGGRTLRDDSHWTSTQCDATRAWRMDMTNGKRAQLLKTEWARIRPIIDYPEE